MCDDAVLVLRTAEGEQNPRDRFASLLAHVAPERILTAVPSHAARVVLDQFFLDKELVLECGTAATIGIDARGSGRDMCSYLVDIMPSRKARMANRRGVEFLDLPEAARRVPDAEGRILVTFGGEDPAGLTEATLDALSRVDVVDPAKVTALRPVLRSVDREAWDAQLHEPVSDIAPLLRANEWVICSYGLTAFEARAAGNRVITVNPSRYHDRLARIAGFTRAGCTRPSRRALKRVMMAGTAKWKAPESARATGSRLLAETVERITPEHTGCPAHGARGRALWRDQFRSFFVCPVCGLVYQERFASDRESYGRSYFDEEYRNQYGRTYLEDFESIRTVGMRRSRMIRRYADGGSLLDIGCAYGPFMAAARASGFAPFGLDISEDASEYVRRELEMPCFTGSVLEFDPAEFGRSDFRVITLWYVIEHFPDLAILLERLKRWVAPGGVLAISTPYRLGVTGRRGRGALYVSNPRDHYSIWDRSSAKKLLDEYGFHVRRFVSTGHHPERYPEVRRGLMPHAAAGAHSRLFGRGDTFEIYAERV